MPALLASFAYGPVSGIAVCLVKNLLHLLATQTAGIGELANFLIGSSFVVTAGVIYKTYKTKKGAAAASLIASVVMGLFCLPVNYYIIYPLYSRFLIPLDAILSMYRQLMPSAGGLFSMLCIFNLPFTVVKKA